MQMENIFEKLITPSDYFLHKTKLHSNNVIKWNLHDYLYEYLNKDNRNLLDINLENALTTIINGKYI
jgi:hypothetical protein